MTGIRRNNCGWLVWLALALWPSGVWSATIDDLAWMQGRWIGPMGDAQLEETWLPPTAGTMVAAVRMSGGGKTAMVELIVIEQQGDDLVLRLQQFSPAYEPRFSPAQALRMTAQDERSVTFEATGPGGLKRITYTRPEHDRFNIHVLLTEGTELVAHLRGAH